MHAMVEQRFIIYTLFPKRRHDPGLIHRAGAVAVGVGLASSSFQVPARHMLYAYGAYGDRRGGERANARRRQGGRKR
jgi:hypothetical protein